LTDTIKSDKLIFPKG